MPVYLFLGSFCAGKTTIIRRLTHIMRARGFNVVSVGININHGPAYLITRFIVFATRYKFIGNHYLSVRFNNPHMFCKYLPLMMLLDALFIPAKYAATLLRARLLMTRGKNAVILIDEYYPNAIIDYKYFTNRLCKKRKGLAKAIYAFFFKVAMSHTIKTLNKFRPTLVVLISSNPLVAVDLWRRREQSKIFDYKHFLYRTAGSIVLASNLRNYTDCSVFNVNDPRRDGTKILKTLIQDMLVR